MVTLRQYARLAAAALSIATCLSMPISSAQPKPAAPDTTWRVVVLNNADFLLPISAIMDQPLRDTLTRESPHPIEVIGEALDSLRHPNDIDEVIRLLLHKKYDGVKVDLVMAASRGSTEFLRRYRDELWPTVPVVFYNLINDPGHEQDELHDSTGVWLDLNATGTLELARRLQPNARAIYIVGGTSNYDLTWKRRLGPLLAPLLSQYAVAWLDKLTPSQVLDTVGRLPPDSIVLFTSMITDAEGHTQVNPQIAGKLAAASSAPVYTFFDNLVSVGVLGGSTTDFPAHGRAAARLALRVLGGEPAGSIPVEAAVPSRCVVDARAMQRFEIDESLLPAGCEVRFRVSSVWQEYRWYIAGALAALIFQSLLIATLYVQRRRRRKAELAAQQQGVELAHVLRLATVGEMTAAISHEINQPLGAILSNADAAEMLLESDEPSIDQLRHILADIRRDDLRASQVVSQIRALLQKHDVRRETIDLNDLALDVVRLLAPEAGRRDIVVLVRSAPEQLRVQGDRVQLQQLLLNLIMNAMDAMEETPVVFRKVTVRVSRSDKRKVTVGVSDTGYGIGPAKSERLFDSFYTTKPGGLGLGLSIARTVAEAHGGTIRAENNPSAGATFLVTLPEAPLESGGSETANGDALKAGAK